MGCLILFSPEVSAVGLDIEIFILFSPEAEGQWLSWVWDVLICSVVRVSSWARYGMFNFVQS